MAPRAQKGVVQAGANRHGGFVAERVGDHNAAERELIHMLQHRAIELVELVGALWPVGELGLQTNQRVHVDEQEVWLAVPAPIGVEVFEPLALAGEGELCSELALEAQPRGLRASSALGFPRRLVNGPRGGEVVDNAKSHWDGKA
jgi:hypothetical protein